MAELKFGIYGDSTSFKKALDDATKGVTQAKNKIESEGKSMESVFGSLKNAATGLGVAFGLNELKNLGIQIAKTRGDFQQLEVSFKTMLGSGEKSNAMLKQLTTTAATTPFGLQEVAGGAKQLLAFGIEAEKVNDIIVRLGDIASGLSIPLGDLVYLYGTTMVQGKMMTQDLKQFQGRGIPIAEELAKQFGVTSNAVGDLVRKGKVGAKEFEQAIVSMTSAGSKFGGLMEAQSKTINGQVSNIEDQVDMLFNSIGQDSEGLINDILGSAGDTIEWLATNYKTLGTAITGIVATYGVWKAVLIAQNALHKANALGEQARLNAVKTAMEQQVANTKASATATTADTIATNQNTIAENQNTTAQQTNSTAQASNTATQVANTTATNADTIATKKGTMAKNLFALAVMKGKTAMQALTHSMKTNVIGWVLTGISAIVSVVMTWTQSQKTLNKALDEGKGKAKEYADALAQETSTIESYVKTIQDKNADDLEQIKAYRELIALVPELTNQYTQQELATMDAVKAEKLLTEAMRERELVKSQKDIDIAQSTLKSLERGAKWDTLQAEQRKFLQDTMGYDRDADEDAMKNALKGFIPTAKNARSALIQLNKISDLKNMKSGKEKVNSLNTELQNVEKRAEFLKQFQNTLYEHAKGETYNDKKPYTDKLKDMMIPKIKELYGVELDLVDIHSGFISYDPEGMLKKAKIFFETYFDGVAEEYDAQKKMLEDEINKEKGIEVNPFAKMNKEQVEKEIEKITQEIADIERALAQNKELENTIIVNSNIPTEKSEQAIKDAQAKLDANAKLLGQDKYVSSNMQYNIAITPQFQFGGQNYDPEAFKSGAWLENIIPTGKGSTQQAADEEKKQLEEKLRIAEARAEELEKLKVVPPEDKKKWKSQKERDADYVEAQQKLKDTEEAIGKERVESVREIEQEIEQARIDAMTDGSEKYLAQLKLDTKKQKEELAKRKDDAINAEKERQKKEWEARENEKVKEAATRKKEYIAKPWTDEELDQSKVNEIIWQYNALGKAIDKVDEASKLKERIDSRNKYLSEYGSSLAQELTITEEYATKIAEARAKGDEYGVKNLENERDAKIKSMQVENLVKNIDWATALGGGFSSAFSGALKPTLDQLIAYSKTDAFSQLDTQNQQAIVNAMNNLTSIIGTSELSWKDLAQNILDLKNAQEELGIAEEEQKVANDNLTNATEQLRLAIANKGNLGSDATDEDKINADEQVTNAERAVSDAQTQFTKASDAVVNANKKVSASQTNLATTSKNVAEPISKWGNLLKDAGIPQLGELFQAFKELQGAIDALKAIDEVAKASKNLGDATNGVGDASKAIADGAKDAGEAFPDAVDGLGDALEKAGFIAKLIGAILKIFDLLKDGIGPLISGVIESILNAVSGILDNILSGEFIAQIFTSLINGIGNILDALTFHLFDGGIFSFLNPESDKTLHEDLEKLSKENEALTHAIGELSSVMEKATVAEANDAYEKSLEFINQSMANTQEQMKRSAKASTAGFLGIGSEGSSAREITKGINAKEWERVSSIVGKSVDSASDFFNLTSEQMAMVARDAPDIYARIKDLADEGHEDASKYMDEYIEYYKQLEELENQWREKITSSSFDSISSEFENTLLDMESSTEDFSNSFEEIMSKMIIGAMMSNKYEGLIQEWYSDFAEYAKDGLNESEASELRERYRQLGVEAQAERDMLFDSIGVTPDSSSSASSASNRGIESMTQQEAEELNGRFTALQIAGEAIRNQATATNALLTTLMGQFAPSIIASEESNSTLKEIRELAISRNAYLSDISDYTKNLIAIKKTLSNIETNTQNL